MTLTEIEDAIYEWITALIDPTVPVIFTNENGVRPPLPYLTIEVFGNNKIGQAYRSSTVQTDGIQEVNFDEDFTVSIQAYGYGSMKYLKELRDLLELESVILTLNELGLAIREENNPINDISISMDGLSIEKRYNYDVLFGTKQNLCEYVGYFEDVEINEGKSDDEVFLPPC